MLPASSSTLVYIQTFTQEKCLLFRCFLRTFAMVDSSNDDDIISWSQTGDSFVVARVKALEELLPLFFSHANFFSFVRQLNFYGGSPFFAPCNIHVQIQDGWMASDMIFVRFHLYHELNGVVQTPLNLSRKCWMCESCRTGKVSGLRHRNSESFFACRPCGLTSSEVIF